MREVKFRCYFECQRHHHDQHYHQVDRSMFFDLVNGFWVNEDMEYDRCIGANTAFYILPHMISCIERIVTDK